MLVARCMVESKGRSSVVFALFFTYTHVMMRFFFLFQV
jgi:hypothetical protein